MILYQVFMGFQGFKALLDPAAGMQKRIGLMYGAIVFALFSANSYTLIFQGREYVQLVNRWRTLISLKKESKSLYYLTDYGCLRRVSF